ncbi:MAG: indole-3-glycerol phosphate synthase TrpC [Candidatus Methanospirareceae archaeon]
MSGRIKRIVERKRREIEGLKERRSLIEAIRRAKEHNKGAIIGEVKRKGLEEGSSVEIKAGEAARAMERGGACAISVLTDEAFCGSLEDLKEVKLSVKLPVLRKDFIFDEFQIYESYVHGADAILLIARFLEGKRLKELVEFASSFGIEALVEIDKESKGKLSEINLEGIHNSILVGINNRDLGTLEVDLATFEEIAPEIKPKLKNVLLVAMSGIVTKEDARRMFDAGADALLIGTSLSQARDKEAKMREFLAVMDKKTIKNYSKRREECCEKL